GVAGLDKLRVVRVMRCVVDSSVRFLVFFFFSSRRRHTRLVSDWSSDVCSSDLTLEEPPDQAGADPLRRPGDHGDLAFTAHHVTPDEEPLTAKPARRCETICRASSTSSRTI